MMTRRILLACLLSGIAPGLALCQEPPIPQLALWEAQMLSYGDVWCDYLTTHTDAENEGQTYYDGIRVFHLIAAYTGDTSTWYPCVDKAIDAYRDFSVIPNNGALPGYWNFTTGLRMDWDARADATSKSSAILLSTNGIYCRDDQNMANLATVNRSREVAYCTMSYINAEAMGEAHRDRLSVTGDNNDYVDIALDHLDQWFVTKDGTCGLECVDLVPICANRYYYQPFMVALTMNSLIKEYARSSDARIPPAIKTALDVMWVDAWSEANGAMWYQNCKDTPQDEWPATLGGGADALNYGKDLNLLLAPAYAWYYIQSADTGYRDKADALFASGVAAGSAFLGWSGKHFNQNYTFSFDYVTYRSEGLDESYLNALGIDAGPTDAVFTLGRDGLDYATDCSIVVKEGASTIETISSTEGLPTRILQTSVVLDASTAYTATQSCTGLANDTNAYSFTTKAAPAAGDRTVTIQAGDPKTIGSVARATVRYDDNAALATPATAQNTSCSTGCSIDLTLAAGRWFYRWEWQDSSDNVLAVGSVQPISVQ